MDLYRLSRMLNSTAGSGNLTQLNLAPTVLEAFIPGYSIISRFISHTTGLDAGAIMSAGLFLFALATAWRYASKSAWFIFTEYISCLVYLDEHDDQLFKSVLDWIAEQRVGRVATRLKAVTAKQGGRPDEDRIDEFEQSGDELFHFGKWAAKVPPKYEPYFGSYVFIWKYRVYIFERGRRERQPVPWRAQSSDEQHIQLRTLGWNTAPLKALLAHIKQWSIERENDITVIKRPQSKDTRRREGAWSRVTSRPSRALDTVVLDPEQKNALIADVNEYLSPAAPRWYASRGIPLRRGYLFHGPPGTGKSSLSFALAGVFGLDIFVISLLEPTLTEEDLQHLFNNLPKRCIVLLEDIDTAGLTREDNKPDDSKSETEYDKISAADLAKELHRANRRGRMLNDVKSEATVTGGGISLSGLLNAIDGVASHEGRVLVMTTNHPEKLDAALIRPGRVDMEVAFTLATKHQINEIFVKMYASDTHSRSVVGPSKRSTAVREYTRVELRPLAEEFARLVPENEFSPAEVQNFLITRKKDPQMALQEVEKWRNDLLDVKEKKARA